jgi:hypothetical protein
MTSEIRYPLVLFYDAACRSKIEPLRRFDTAGRLELVESTTLGGIRARDASGRSWVGIVALEAAYRAAWDGKVAL